MRFTDDAQYALLLGLNMARSGWSAEASRYPEAHEQMVDYAQKLGLETEMPVTHTAFKESEAELVGAVFQELGEQRRWLGADGYSFPFFVMSYSLFQLGAAEQLGEPLTDDDFGPLVDALIDLNIDASAEAVRTQLKNAVDHVAAETFTVPGGDTGTNPSDVLMIWSLVLRQVLERWMESERRDAADLPPISLDAKPLHSCFISYSHHDEAFAEHLKTSLLLAGAQVWMAPDQIAAGDLIADHINDGLDRSSKLLVVLSEDSMKSPWVRYEIKQSLQRGPTPSAAGLVAVRLASEDQIRAWELVDTNSGTDLAQAVRDSLVADFEHWQDASAFETSFASVLEGLRRFRAADSDARAAEIQT